MKTKILALILFSLSFCVSLSAQSSTFKADPTGTWKFEAPYAPEGYNTGTIEVSMTDQKYNTTMSFTGSEYKISGEKVKLEKDNLSFLVYLEGQDINVSLKFESELKMTGKAVYSEGEVPITLTKAVSAGKK